MSSSRLRNTFSLFQKPKTRWSDPEGSIGRFRGIKKGKFNCWEAEGSAKEVFERIQPHIAELLESACGPVPSSSFLVFDIFMIGETQETALPYIMFSCKRREPRKIAVAAMKKSNILDQCPPGIRFGEWDYPPYLKDLRYLASDSRYKDPDIYTSRENESISSPFDKDFVSVPNSYKLGMGRALQLALPITSTSTEPGNLRTATIGSIVTLSGRRFYLAPAHVCYQQGPISTDMVPEEDSSPEDSECEFEGLDDEDEGLSDAQEVDFMSQYSMTPESSDLEEDWDLNEDGSTSDAESECLTPGVQAERENSSIFNPGDDAYYVPEDVELSSSLHCPCAEVEFPFLKSDSLDYCLIEVDEIDNYLTDLPVLSRENIGQLSTGSVDVMAATGSGNVLTGILSSRLLCIRLPNATRYINVLSVQFSGSLQSGDSGSIVRDASTGMIYGHIVAGDTGSQTAIIIPAVDVLNDLIAKSARAETPSAEHNHETFTHQMELETTSNENGGISVRTPRKCPFCLENAGTHHIAKHLRMVACFCPPESVGGHDGSLPGSQIPGRAEIISNTTRNIETTSQTSSRGAEFIYQADYNVDWKNKLPLTVKSHHQQQRDPKDEEWKVDQFLERLESQSAQDTPLGIDTIEPDGIDPTSNPDSISLTRPNYSKRGLKQKYTVGWICAISSESVAAQAFLNEEKDSPFSNTSSYQAHQLVSPPQVKNTCRWFLDDSKFQAWKSRDHERLLWLSADPGNGKSVLSRALVDDTLVGVGSTIILCSFRGNEEQNSTATAMCTPLHLLSCAKKGLFREYTKKAVQQFGERPALDFESLWQTWTSATPDFSTGNVFCLLDALDECPQLKRDRLIQERLIQERLIQELERFFTSCPARVDARPNVRFLEYFLPPQDITDYAFGQIGKHNVVISTLPTVEYGTSWAANMAKNMIHRFPNIGIAIMIGIGGGLPSSKQDICLGNISSAFPIRVGVVFFSMTLARQFRDKASNLQVFSISHLPPGQRNSLAAQEVLCFEMEALELMRNFLALRSVAFATMPIHIRCDARHAEH
ncbi:hypothetical protein N7467_003873 [Penicillium canescens]|nr:hypothetical protein N7467_003873 [Penicillium canescens]